MSRPCILVTGADSQLGQSLQKLAPTINADFVFASRRDMDIADVASVVKFFSSKHFDFCVNTAAYTKVDLAEQESEQAASANSIAPAILAGLCKNDGGTLIHISSDYVYHNGLTRPLKEDDPTSPKSAYALLKLQGERFAFDANPRTVIVRTSWLFSEYGHNFVKTMARLINARTPLRIVNDQIGCPTYAGDLAQAILKIITTLQSDNRDELYGIFNYCNEGQITWYDFAREIARMLGIKADITPVSTEEYGAVAARPPYSVLDTTKIRERYQVKTPHWRERLKDVLQKL